MRRPVGVFGSSCWLCKRDEWLKERRSFSSSYANGPIRADKEKDGLKCGEITSAIYPTLARSFGQLHNWGRSLTDPEHL